MPFSCSARKKEYQKEYQKKYRENNKLKASASQKEWRLNNSSDFKAENTGNPLTNRDVILCVKKTNGKYTHSIAFLAKKLGRSYASISSARHKYKET